MNNDLEELHDKAYSIEVEISQCDDFGTHYLQLHKNITKENIKKNINEAVVVIDNNMIQIVKLLIRAKILRNKLMELDKSL